MNDRGIAILVLFIIFFGFNIWFYWPKFDYCGVVVDKWVESSTHCDDEGSCSTSHDYIIQFDDGNVYGTFWGTRIFDNTITGKKYCYTMRGREWRFFDWRIAKPSIFNFKLQQEK